MIKMKLTRIATVVALTLGLSGEIGRAHVISAALDYVNTRKDIDAIIKYARTDCWASRASRCRHPHHY